MYFSLQLPTGVPGSWQLIYKRAARVAKTKCIFASSCHLNHLRHLLPSVFILIHRDAGAISPVQKPIFKAMNALVQVNIRAQLIAGPAPRKLPPIITFQLIIPCPRFNIIKAQPIELRVLQVLSATFPPFFYYVFAFFVHDSSCGPASMELRNGFGTGPLRRDRLIALSASQPLILI